MAISRKTRPDQTRPDQTMSSSVSPPVLNLHNCHSERPCQFHSDLWSQSQPKAQHHQAPHDTHDKPGRQYPQWSQAGQLRLTGNEEEDLLKEWSL